MKRIKKALVSVIALALLISVLCISALAVVTGHTVTITSETTGHTYQAYRIFAGVYSETGSGDKVLSNITWGSGVQGASLLAALKADATYGSHFTACTTAADAAEAIGSITDADFPDAFAVIVSNNLTSTFSSSGAPSGSGPYTYTISGLADGYYFIKEADFIGTVDNSYTKFMLQVLDDVCVAAKTDKPSVAKKVLENNDVTYSGSWNDAADYNLGDAVPFRVVGLVPDMTYFDTYYYKFTDTLSSGLTFNSSSVHVYYVSSGTMYDVETSTATGAGGSALNASTYALTDTGSGFTLTFTDLTNTAGVPSAGSGYIVIEYTATLNANAVINNPGNPNEVYLTYSNNPNDTSDKGQTPKDEVVAFTFNLPVNKVDENESSLTGATFAVFKNEADADAAVSDPTALTNALKFSGSAGVYKLDASGTVKELESNASGAYSIKGLDQGTYYLVEIDAPTGYNRLTAPVEVVIAPTYNSGSTSSAYVNGHLPDATLDQLTAVGINDGTSLTVENQAGSTLPETGGIGTTIFTIGGLVLMLGAAVLLITKRKMSSQK